MNKDKGKNKIICPICDSASKLFKKISDVDYYECNNCSSLFADPSFIIDINSHSKDNYSTKYWEKELHSARERSFGSSLQRVAETFLYSRIPINNFIDLGSGPGFLLDALSYLLPSSLNIFHGVELFPPDESFRTNNPNYFIGSIDEMEIMFDAGVCIEVIEHLSVETMHSFVEKISFRSNPGAIYYFGSGQPDYVKNEDPDYLDPLERGHIISYSLRGLEIIFNKYGFRIIPLYGRSWCFLAELANNSITRVQNAEDLLSRLWSALPHNVNILKDKMFGPLMYSIGIESARCYIEHAISNERTLWAIELNNKLISIGSKC
jgi:hypothetical protein